MKRTLLLGFILFSAFYYISFSRPFLLSWYLDIYLFILDLWTYVVVKHGGIMKRSAYIC